MILSPRLFRQSRAVCFPPPKLPVTFPFDNSGSILLTNSDYSIDIIRHSQRKLSSEKAHQHLRRLVTLMISRRFFCASNNARH